MSKKNYPILLTILSIFFTIIFLELLIGKYFDFSKKLGINKLGDPTVLLSNDSIIEDIKFYDEDVYFDLKSKEKIIVSIGDSFTEGYPVSFEDQYTQVLKRQFNSDNVGVLNMGLGNTSPDQQIKIFEKHVLSRMSPDIVIWQFYPNDIWDSLHYQLFSLDSSNQLIELDGKDSWLYKVHQFYSNISFLGKYRSKSNIVKLIVYFIETQNKYKEVPNEIEDMRSWSLAKIDKELDYMEALSKKHGFQLHYVLITPQLVYESNPQNFQESLWILDDYKDVKKLFDDKELIEINFLTAESKNSTQSGESISEKYFVSNERDLNAYGDRHFNELGYKLMSEQIYQSITSTQSATIK